MARQEKEAEMTKRQLGLLFIFSGLAAVIVLFAADLVGASQFDGIGPLQRLGLAGAAIAIILGVSLLPLGNRPA